MVFDVSSSSIEIYVLAIFFSIRKHLLRIYIILYIYSYFNSVFLSVDMVWINPSLVNHIEYIMIILLEQDADAIKCMHWWSFRIFGFIAAFSQKTASIIPAHMQVDHFSS